MDIGELLRNKRLEKGLTQRDVADAVKVSEGTVSRWESGKIGNMRRDRIQALADYLSIDPVIITRAKQSNTERVATATGLAGAAVATAAGLAAPAVATVGLASALAGAFEPLRNLLSAMGDAGINEDGTPRTVNELPILVNMPDEIKLMNQYRLLNDADKTVAQALINSLAQKYTALKNDADQEQMPNGGDKA